MTPEHVEDLSRRIHLLGERALIASLAIDALKERDTVTGLLEIGSFLKAASEDLCDIAEMLLLNRPEEEAQS
jgi:uncharacterized protein with PhoU and TrkA domain